MARRRYSYEELERELSEDDPPAVRLAFLDAVAEMEAYADSIVRSRGNSGVELVGQEVLEAPVGVVAERA